MLNREGINGQLAHSTNNVRQIGLALRLYAEDNDGKMPLFLSELSPEFLAADSLPKLRFRGPDGKNDFDWLYYPKANFKTLPESTILAASPHHFRSGNKDRRIVLLRDCSALTMPEPEFQKQIQEQNRVAAP